MKKRFSLLVLLACCSALTYAQKKGSTPAAPADTAKHPAPLAPRPPQTGPKPYKEIITDKAITRKGLFTVHKIEDKWFFEMGDSLLGRDVLVVNRISKAPANTRAGFFGYAGDEINENVIRFEKGPNNRLFMRNISYSVYARDSTKPMYKSVMASNIQPIAASFDIKAFSKDSTGVVIDITDFVNSDNDILFFASYFKQALRIGGPQPDKSYIADIKSYPINTEIKTVKTYGRMPAPGPFPGASAGPAGNATFELNSSLVLLPKDPMQARHYDDRVAYFTTEYTDFDADPQGVKDISLITRWRLEPKEEDMEKYKRGELVEPKKPIIYYIDPNTPEKWVPYLIAGVNDWQKAFEKAGFKNAIMARRAPTHGEDSTWSLEDARYSAVVYKPSDIPNAMGPHVHDPRSGEILESHINWYHNVMALLHNWYLIQASPSDPRARTAHFNDSLMGDLIRFVSSHEVGHTLGLPHNMGASSATPVEKLRDKTWVEEHGHTSSIMDYARFNYVAQPEDKIGSAGMYPRIGDYDLWSIEWGYKLLPGKTEDEEKDILNDWVKSRYNNPRLRFIHADGVDPRAQTESLGDDAMKANEYGIKNLKWILPQLPKWLNEKADDYKNLDQLYDEVYNTFSRYMGHAVTYIGGSYTDLKTTDQDGAVYTVVPKALQKEAMTFLQKNLFTTPTWLLNKAIMDKVTSPVEDKVSGLQDVWLGALLNTNRLSRLITETNRDANAYRIDEFMEDLKKGIFSELAAHAPIDNFRRNLQKSFVEKMSVLASITPAAPAGGGGGIFISFGGPTVDVKKTDISSVARGELRTLKAQIAAAAATYGDKMSKYHLQDLNERIDRVLNPR